MALSCKAVLRVLLAVWCCYCGYGIICPSYGLYGSISIYYKAGLRVSGCMHTYAYNLTIMCSNQGLGNMADYKLECIISICKHLLNHS